MTKSMFFTVVTIVTFLSCELSCLVSSSCSRLVTLVVTLSTQLRWLATVFNINKHFLFDKSLLPVFS